MTRATPPRVTTCATRLWVFGHNIAIYGPISTKFAPVVHRTDLRHICRILYILLMCAIFVSSALLLPQMAKINEFYALLSPSEALVIMLLIKRNIPLGIYFSAPVWPLTRHFCTKLPKCMHYIAHLRHLLTDHDQSFNAATQA